ncbi:hypothetical protein BOQ62_19290 [Chryseobacterium sp. CH21]|uniref:T9SS type A sorting domain-containing protein n=1 Tax=Chryseobacterium sp. CH21 TaxID=713556 RepID=UPI00100ABCEE|nr:T9SS type A sorting domain-containing protein [Chryseobacterium sp. CH21]RXM38071.1 hypothetical protein BOQ62_19290 [Chryseobacterium sp. CH21]
MKKCVLIFLLIYSAFCSAQISIYEDFERPSLPWYNNTAIYGWTPVLLGSTSCSGTRASKAYVTTFSNPTDSLIYTTNYSDGTELKYSFKYFVESMTNYSSGGIITTSYSLNGGTTWIDLGTPITFLVPIAGSPIPCTLVSGIIPAGIIPAGSTFKFRVMVKNTVVANNPAYPYTTVGIDDVKLEQTPTAIPSCQNTGIYFSDIPGGIDPLRTDILWYPARGATGYFISLGTTPGGNDIINNLDVGNATHYFIQNLYYSKQYFVSVIPYNSFGSASCNLNFAFTTKALPCPQVSNPYPSIYESPNSHFNWSAVPDAAGYRITLGTTPQGGEILNDIDLGNVTDYSFPVPVMEYATQYYFKIIAYNNWGSSSPSCGSIAFKTKSPCFPFLFPEDNTGGVSLTPNFTWDGNPESRGYSLSLGTNPEGNNILNNIDVGKVYHYQLTQSLNPGTLYRWTVQSYGVSPIPVYCNFKKFYTTSSALGVNEIKSEDAFKIFPIPARDFLFIDSKKKIKNINVYDFSGRKLNSIQVFDNKIDIRDFSTGNYILKIEFSDGTSYNKTITKE